MCQLLAIWGVPMFGLSKALHPLEFLHFSAAPGDQFWL